MIRTWDGRSKCSDTFSTSPPCTPPFKISLMRRWRGSLVISKAIPTGTRNGSGFESGILGVLDGKTNNKNSYTTFPRKQSSDGTCQLQTFAQRIESHILYEIS